VKFDYNEEQRLLAESVRRFVAQDYTFERRKKIVDSREGYSTEVWATLAELGLLGIPFAPEDGGFGGGAVDLMAVMEAFGDALVVEPFLPTLMGARLVALAGNGEQRERDLAPVIAGEKKMAFAYLEPEGRDDVSHVALEAHREGGGYRLDGRKAAVLHAQAADRIVVTARTAQGLALFVVARDAPGVRLEARRTFDEMRVADIDFADVRVDAAARLGNEDALPLVESVVDFATALVCAEAVGAIKSANDATLEYLKTRKQFGVPIGAFQALQHRMVDMVVHYEQARSMASLACAKVDSERDAGERARVVSAAKIRIGDACRHVSQEAVQLHGGMGMTDELKVSHTFRRLTVIGQQFGDVQYHLDRFARCS
jgi:alkylation response protein AidB-like acyl-CoA dehydrogenase